jgi:RNA polymerase sigma-B factor
MMTPTATRSRRASHSTHRSPSAIELIARWQQSRDSTAREELCTRFLPLARRLALRYRNPHEPADDLIQVASVGLLDAIDRFSIDRGDDFVAFAVPTILGELKRHFRSTGWAVHVPRGAQELAQRIDRAITQISVESGRTPEVRAIAEYLELSTEDVLVGLETRSAHYSTSLDAPAVSEEADDAPPLIETLGRSDDGFELVEARQWLSTGLHRLPYLERRALNLRLRGGLKQIEIAQELGCSQMQVSRLLRRAAHRLRQQTEPASPTRGA